MTFLLIDESSGGDYTFSPLSHHSIKTSLTSSQVYGGILHALPVQLLKQTYSLPVSHIDTTFLTRSNSSDLLTISKKVIFEKEHDALFKVEIYQNNTMLSFSFITCSDRSFYPYKGDPIKYYVPKLFYGKHTWHWDPEGETILGLLDASLIFETVSDHSHVLSMQAYADLSLKNYTNDIVINSLFADFSAMLLPFQISQVGKTYKLSTHFFVHTFPQQTILSHLITGFSRGSVNVNLIQLDSTGSPLSSTDAVFSVFSSNDVVSNYLENTRKD